MLKIRRPRSVARKVSHYQIVYVVGVLLLLLVPYAIPEDGVLNANVEIHRHGKVTVDLLLEAIKLVNSLSIALFTACGALAVKGKDWSNHWHRVDGYLIVVALVAGTLSIYGTYLSYVALAEVTYAGYLDIESARLKWALAIQYYSLLAGVFILGLVFTRMLEGRKTPIKESLDR